MFSALTLHLHLPGCASLKEKRGRIKPFMARLRREFNLSVAEMDRQDAWQEAVITCVMVANDRAYLDSAMQSVLGWVEANWSDGDLLSSLLELV